MASSVACRVRPRISPCALRELAATDRVLVFLDRARRGPRVILGQRVFADLARACTEWYAALLLVHA